MVLSYRHAFHAGGPSDVFKHVCVLALLQSRLTAAVDSNRRIKRSWLALIETHSGAGLYSLGTGLSLKLREHEAGISRLIASWDVSECGSQLRECKAISSLVHCVLHHNSNSSDTVYPGSPLIALDLVRRELNASGPSIFFELHTTDYPILKSALYHCGLPNVKAVRADGFKEVRQFVSERRAGVSPDRFVSILVDPSYEVKSEYDQVVALAQCVAAGMPHSQVSIWYPRLRCRKEPDAMVARLTEVCDEVQTPWLNANFDTESRDGERGLYGSGLFVVNPPIGGSKVLEQTLPVLIEALGSGQFASWSVQEGGSA